MSQSDKGELFIGGPWDGERRREDKARSHMQITGFKPLPMAPGASAEVTGEVVVCTYARRQFLNSTAWCDNSLLESDVADRLFNAYERQAKRDRR